MTPLHYASILLFTASGCADIPEAANTWSEREGNILKVGCQESDETWALKCRGHHWIGLPKTCTKTSGITNILRTALSFRIHISHCIQCGIYLLHIKWQWKCLFQGIFTCFPNVICYSFEGVAVSKQTPVVLEVKQATEENYGQNCMYLLVNIWFIV